MDRSLARQLQSVSFFRDLSFEVLDLIAARMVPRTVPEGRILFRKGEPCRGVYLLVKGRVQIYRSSLDGREQILHTETPVQSIAELPLFDGGAYPASARAVEESRLYFLSLDDFQRLYREHPEIADAVIRNLGLRLRKLVKLVERISLKSISARVASFLLEEVEESGPLENGVSIRLKQTQAELARLLATTRESVARALAELRREGVIRQKGREVTVLSVAGLEVAARDE